MRDECLIRAIVPPTDRQDDHTLSVSRDDEVAGLSEHFRPASFLQAWIDRPPQVLSSAPNLGPFDEDCSASFSET